MTRGRSASGRASISRVSSSALRVTAAHLADLENLAEAGDPEAVRRAVFELVAQIRGERPGGAPNLRVVVAS